MWSYIANSVKIFLLLEPYKILFFMGAIFAMVGSMLWFFLQIGFINFYPKAAHANLMFFGFLWSFISGFLMTAIPKMTRTQAATPIEMAFTILLIILQLLFNLSNKTEITVAVFILQIALLFYFGLSRILKIKKIPFVGFIFLPVGFIQAILGGVLYLAEYEPVRSAPYILYGESLIFNLILGLGSRLIPVISRLPNALSPDVASKKEIWTKPLLVLFFFNLGIWLQIFGHTDLGTVFKIIAVGLAAIFHFGIFRKPVVISSVGIGLKISILFMLAGLVLNFSYFNYGLAALHLVYIGGFSLLTIMISFRVIVSHGGQDIAYEVSSRRIAWISYTISSAAVLRFLGMFNYSSVYISASVILLSLAALLWLGKHFSILRQLP